MNTPSKQAILVTGASSGIGYDLSLALAKRGHPVFATARKEEDLQALAAFDNITPVRLDVRRPEEVRQAVETVRKAGWGLYGLVNNAGLGGLGMVSTWTDEDLLDIFEVNVFGPYRLTNACMPLLLESRGRMVLIGSQGGVISKKYYGPYTMTKHALEAYAITLECELAEYGVKVSIVQPGGVVSAIGKNAFPDIVKRFERAQAPFDEEAKAVLASFEQPEQAPDPEAEESENNRKPSPPEVVTKAVMDALFSGKPKLRYLVGTKWEGDRVLNAILERLLDENDNPVHNYSRDELVAMLDSRIAGREAGG